MGIGGLGGELLICECVLLAFEGMRGQLSMSRQNDARPSPWPDVDRGKNQHQRDLNLPGNRDSERGDVRLPDPNSQRPGTSLGHMSLPGRSHGETMRAECTYAMYSIPIRPD